MDNAIVILTTDTTELEPTDLQFVKDIKTGVLYTGSESGKFNEVQTTNSPLWAHRFLNLG